MVNLENLEPEADLAIDIKDRMKELSTLKANKEQQLRHWSRQ